MGEALYSQQTQDRELTVVQIMNSLLPLAIRETQIKTTLKHNYTLIKMVKIKKN